MKKSGNEIIWEKLQFSWNFIQMIEYFESTDWLSLLIFFDQPNYKFHAGTPLNDFL